MIRVVIIEDEIPARKKLKRFLEEINNEVLVVAEIGTVTEAVEFLKNEKSVDLIFSDIELQDGNAFEIYDEIKVSCPIIFTTAYNQFLMNAFESNGIEYLLKPFSLERFQKAWSKFLMFRKSDSESQDLVSKLNQILKNSVVAKSFKVRFSVHSGHGISFVQTEDILFFTAEEGVVFAIDKMSKKHLLSHTALKEIEELINPSDFFRINRSEIISKKYIERIERYSKNAIAIKLENYKKNLITSQSNTSSFRSWIDS